jgi:uncharacterized protein YndB with AHSA1/START domain
MALENDAYERSEAPSLLVTRVFDAPRQLVFKAWTDPAHLARWWGPQGFTLPSCKADFRPGGAYRFHMRGPDGTDHYTQGVFHELVEPERIVLGWCWTDAEGKPNSPQTLVTVTFEDQGQKTKLTLRQEFFESVADRDAHHNGWSSALECLAEYLATL